MSNGEYPANHSSTNGVVMTNGTEDGIVFVECSHRVHYNNSPSSPRDSNEVLLRPHEGHKTRSIKAGTVEKLVEYLAPVSEESDPSYLSCFLLTYRTFLTPDKLLQMLTERYLRTISSSEYTSEQQLRIQKGLVSFLKVWLDRCPGDFNDYPRYDNLTQLKTFAHKKFRDSSKEVVAVCDQMKKKFISFRISLSSDLDIDPRDELSFPTFNLFSLDALQLAEQLTEIAAGLFCKIESYECLNYVMNQNSRDKRQETAPTVCATIDQFNRVSLAVIATVLQTTDPTGTHCSTHRGKALTRWIEVAQHCRRLKNFTAIKAILAGLQSSSLHRLKKTWALVPPEMLTLFDELSSLFAMDSNSQSSRELLDKEGTAKYATGTVEKKKNRTSGTPVNGVVPWLGTFITDLVMIDSAHSAYTPEGYINFDKCRRFFEVLAKITLYQKAATTYHLQSDPAVKHWLTNLQTYSDRESYEKSKVLEPDGSVDSPQVPSLRQKIKSFFRGSSDEFTLPFTPPSSSSPPSSATKSSPSPCKSLRSPGSPPLQLNSRTTSTDSLSSSPIPPDSRVIRVSLGTSNDCMYKSLILKESHRTADVIRIALDKLGVDDDNVDQYNLIQLLAKNKQLVIPDRTNVFWAMNTTTDNSEHLQFTLQPKST
ncbi:ral guanine nucleotide dissociation stimulator-like 1 [Dysidea avara]|uniref:ral guanine nucleotide dissociation stimulator-like 1 n=1 Tax=Dysidea avara TaxID=196820 RepID=UPI0033333E48